MYASVRAKTHRYQLWLLCCSAILSLLSPSCLPATATPTSASDTGDRSATAVYESQIATASAFGTRLAQTGQAPATSPPLPATTILPAPTGPILPVIERFDADQTEITPGEPVNFEWTIHNATRAILFRSVDAPRWLEGSETQTWAVNSNSGAQQVYEGNFLAVTYQLIAYDGAGHATRSSVTLHTRCSGTYFFNFPNGCSTHPAVATRAIEQAFEHGRMVWVEQMELSGANVIIMYTEPIPNQWVIVQDTWRSDEPATDPTLTPPAGLLQPERGFGKVWRELSLVRERLGWAVGPEQAFQSVIQYDASASSIFFRSGPTYPETVTWLSSHGWWRVIQP